MPDYDKRVRNYYGHEAQDLKSREELVRRGVSPDTPNMPSADYTHEGMARTVRPDAAQKETIGNYLLRKIGLADLPQQPETIQQTQERITGAGSLSSQDLARLNELARRAGYRNYEEFKLRDAQRGQATTTTGQRARGALEQGMRNAMAMHPREMFNYVAEKMRQAVGN